ncbi:MAG: lytic transglycosylase domain-containing protein [Desulfobacterales bacterium]|nr:MAG: lytic transglycosylase domain-containing protein [Desulfobacterales bacterium]
MMLGVTFAASRINQPLAIPEGKQAKGVTVVALQSLDKNVPPKKPEKTSTADCDKKVECVLHPIILKAADLHQIDPALIKAIIMAESGYKIRAISKRGAKGLMQLMPQTAQALGVTDVFNPTENISGGVRYFKQLVNQFDGDIKLALAAYNAGSRKVRHYNGIPPFKATKYYIKKVFKYYNLYKNQMTGKLGKA